MFGTTKEIYLDWASAAPVSSKAWKAFLDASKEQGNPSSPHTYGVRAKSILEEARLSIARLAGVKRENVIFTSGATEANNLAIQGHVRALAENGRPYEDMHILYLPSAHASVVESVTSLVKLGVNVEPLGITNGAIDLAILKSLIRPQTVLVAVDVVCGETGTRYAVRDVRRVLDAASKELGMISRITLFADASQAPLVESFELTHLGADLLTLDAQKVGGVRGIGALLRSNVLIPLTPVMYGGGQEEGLRPGTEQPAVARAFATALTELTETRLEFVERAKKYREELIASISKAIPTVQINEGKEVASHIVNVSFPGRDTDYGVMLLSKAGIAVSTKSACETNEEGSRAVQLLTGDRERARSTLRISWGSTTTQKDLRIFAQKLIETLAFLDAHPI